LQVKNKTRFSQDTQERIFSKIMILRFSIAKVLGCSNLKLLLETLYDSLYAPEKMVIWIERLKIPDESCGFYGRHNALKYQLNLPAPPEKSIFNMILETDLMEHDYSNCLFPGIYEVLLKMILLGPVRIWTAASVDGVPKSELPFDYDSDLPGSDFQYKKVRNTVVTGVNQLVKRYIKSSQGKCRQKLHQILVKAGRNKQKMLEDIVKDFRKLKVDRLWLFDDRKKYIDMAREIIDYPKEHHLMRIGPAGDMERLSDLNKFFWRLMRRRGLTGFVVDWDGVCMDDKKRHQAEAVVMMRALEAF